MASFYVENFGCRATQSDGAALERQFVERGLAPADGPQEAQIVVLNTCTVTVAADQDARAAIRRIHRENPGCQIVVTGCYAQRAPEEIAALPGVAAVVGNSHKQVLADLALKSAAQAEDRGSLKSGVQVAGRGSPLAGTEACWPAPADRPSVNPSNQVSNFVPLASLANDEGPTTNDAFVNDEQRTANDSSENGKPATDNGEQRTENGFSSADNRRLTTNDGCLTTDDRRLTTIHVSDIFAHTELLAAPVFDAANERTRPNLKVQDGCDNRCSFCVIPYVRGQSRSLKLQSVIREVEQLVDAGYREVVISGINLGRWGRDFSVVSPQSSVLRNVGYDQFENREPRTENRSGLSGNGERKTENPTPRANSMCLVDLIQSILDETDLQKLRISSVEPMDWTDELINLVATSPRVAKHAHVPMQSGSDRVLRAMHRKYRPWHYREKILKIRAAMPSAAIGADVMVGFPGETDADFEETHRMIDELPFTYLHVFTYSARPGTPAASLRNQVPVNIARARNRILRDVASQKKLAFMQAFVGKTIQAITLNVFDGEYTEALTDNYLKLRLAGKYEPNQWMEARVEGVGSGMLLGSVGLGLLAGAT